MSNLVESIESALIAESKQNKWEEELVKLMNKYKLKNGDWNIIDGYIPLEKFIKERESKYLKVLMEILESIKSIKGATDDYIELADYELVENEILNIIKKKGIEL